MEALQVELASTSITADAAAADARKAGDTESDVPNRATKDLKYQALTLLAGDDWEKCMMETLKDRIMAGIKRHQQENPKMVGRMQFLSGSI